MKLVRFVLVSFNLTMMSLFTSIGTAKSITNFKIEALPNTFVYELSFVHFGQRYSASLNEVSLGSFSYQAEIPVAVDRHYPECYATVTVRVERQGTKEPLRHQFKVFYQMPVAENQVVHESRSNGQSQYQKKTHCEDLQVSRLSQRGGQFHRNHSFWNGGRTSVSSDELDRRSFKNGESNCIETGTQNYSERSQEVRPLCPEFVYGGEFELSGFVTVESDPIQFASDID